MNPKPPPSRFPLRHFGHQKKSTRGPQRRRTTPSLALIVRRSRLLGRDHVTLPCRQRWVLPTDRACHGMRRLAVTVARGGRRCAATTAAVRSPAPAAAATAVDVASSNGGDGRRPRWRQQHRHRAARAPRPGRQGRGVHSLRRGHRRLRDAQRHERPLRAVRRLPGAGEPGETHGDDGAAVGPPTTGLRRGRRSQRPANAAAPAAADGDDQAPHRRQRPRPQHPSRRGLRWAAT